MISCLGFTIPPIFLATLSSKPHSAFACQDFAISTAELELELTTKCSFRLPIASVTQKYPSQEPTCNKIELLDIPIYIINKKLGIYLDEGNGCFDIGVQF